MLPRQSEFPAQVFIRSDLAKAVIDADSLQRDAAAAFGHDFGNGAAQSADGVDLFSDGGVFNDKLQKKI